MKRTYTNIGAEQGYSREEINTAINTVDYESFRMDNLPFCQGECIKAVVSQCNIPLKGISHMFLHGLIKVIAHGFYALKVKYKDGIADIYIADDGVNPCVVASDFVKN